MFPIVFGTECNQDNEHETRIAAMNTSLDHLPLDGLFVNVYPVVLEVEVACHPIEVLL
jgi:hypothetical protein